MESLPKGVRAVQFQYSDLSKLHERFVIMPPLRTFQSNGVLSESYDNFMPAVYLRVQIRNSMSSRKNALHKC